MDRFRSDAGLMSCGESRLHLYGMNRLRMENPTTGEPEVRPIYEVMSSHSARRAFSGNMYDKVQDPNLICALTGHKEGSKSFARYRKIDEDTNRKTISLLE